MGIVLIARSSLADHYHVPSGSMLPTLDIGDQNAVDKRAYALRLPLTPWRLVTYGSPERGDVIVFPSPESGDVLVKRVVAVGGDEVEVREGRVSIDGVAMRATWANEGWVEELEGRVHAIRLGDGGPDFGPVRVPEGSLLVLGDNRGGSHDGRLFGFVREKDVTGRVVGVFVRHGRPTWVRPEQAPIEEAAIAD